MSTITDREIYEDMLASGSRPTDTFEAFQSLLKWDREYVDGSSRFATSDWPGIETLDNPWPSRSLVLVQPNRSPARPRKEFISSDLRWQVWERDNFTCRHCGSRRRLSIDHIIAESKGGATVLENLQTLCTPCNCRKGARDV